MVPNGCYTVAIDGNMDLTLSMLGDRIGSPVNIYSGAQPDAKAVRCRFDYC